MNIDWSKAPEGATHYNCGSQFFYRFTPQAEFWADAGYWADAAGAKPDDYVGDRWIVKATQEEQTRNDIIDLIWRKCGAQGDMIRQLATVLVAEGYRTCAISDR